MNQTETKLPKLPRGWSYQRHEHLGDGSGGPWIEANGPTDDGDGDWVSLETCADANVVKWGTIDINLGAGGEPCSPKDLARVIVRVRTLQKVAAMLRAWARKENRRPHEPVYAAAKETKP